MRMQILSTIPCAAMLLGLGACAADLGSESTDDEAVVEASEEVRVLAELDIAGGKAIFLGEDANTITILTTTAGAMPLRDPAIHDLTAGEIYEYWSGRAAPAELAKYAVRMQLPDSALQRERVQSETPGVAATASALTAAEFDQMFCWDRPNEICATDGTGTWEPEGRSRYWQGAVNAVLGDVTIQMRRRSAAGTWSQLWKSDVFQGQVISGLSASSGAVLPRWLKFKIFNADGDHWHVQAHWYGI